MAEAAMCTACGGPYDLESCGARKNAIDARGAIPCTPVSLAKWEADHADPATPQPPSVEGWFVRPIWQEMEPDYFELRISGEWAGDVLRKDEGWKAFRPRVGTIAKGLPTREEAQAALIAAVRPKDAETAPPSTETIVRSVFSTLAGWGYKISDAEIAEALAAATKMRMALAKISSQSLTAEMDEDTLEHGDFKGAHDEFVQIARTALSSLPVQSAKVEDGDAVPAPVARSEKDYAIEFGGYLATAAAAYAGGINQMRALRAVTKTAELDELRDLHDGLQSAIYEFRKRVPAPALPEARSPEPGKGVTVARPMVSDNPQTFEECLDLLASEARRK